MEFEYLYSELDCSSTEWCLLWHSGKLALDGLGFDVEVYYASEVDSKAILVTQDYHGNRVNQVGDVCKLTTDEVWFSSLHSASML